MFSNPYLCHLLKVKMFLIFFVIPREDSYVCLPCYDCFVVWLKNPNISDSHNFLFSSSALKLETLYCTKSDCPSVLHEGIWETGAMVPHIFDLGTRWT